MADDLVKRLRAVEGQDWEHTLTYNGLRLEAAATIDELRARILELEAERQWRPMETAPKDGSRILLAKIVGHPSHPTALWWAVAGHWSEKWSNWNDDVEPCGLASPNYWQPLPPAPEGK